MPWIRRVGNLGLSFLTKAASGYWNIFDPTNGFTAISRDALSLLDFDKLAQRYYFEISILQELGRHRLVVEDVFIPAKYNQEVSSLSPGKLLLEFPQLILTATIKRILFLYFIRDFTAASLFIITGLIGILFGFIWGGFFWIKSTLNHVPATTGTVMISVLPLIIGLQLLLQAIVMDIQNIPTRKSR
jgi:dolichol-phosphate mannosyltransferase